MAFGVNRSAQAALELMGPSARACLDRAGGVQNQGVRISIAQGEDKGTVVYEQYRGKLGTSIVQRANLLHEFLADIPDERMHASKKLVKYDRQQDGSLVLSFADGTTHDCE